MRLINNRIPIRSNEINQESYPYFGQMSLIKNRIPIRSNVINQ